MPTVKKVVAGTKETAIIGTGVHPHCVAGKSRKKSGAKWKTRVRCLTSHKAAAKRATSKSHSSAPETGLLF